MADAQKRIEYKNVEVLYFDPENPRLPTTVNGENEGQVLEWMLKDASIIELMGSIGKHGYFNGEPLLIVPGKENPHSKYHVVEGNRRLAAVKFLLNPSLAPIRKNSVLQASKETTEDIKEGLEYLPVLEFPERVKILDYLGYRHITGVKPWSSLAKAKYLKKLRNRDPEASFYDLAKQIGSRSDYVARLLTALALYEAIEDNRFFGIEGLNEETISFSLITTAINYTNIANFLGLGGSQNPELRGLQRNSLRKVTKWFFEKDQQGNTPLGESRNIKQLNAVVANNRALEAFEGKARLDEAYLLTGEPMDAFRTLLDEARVKLQAAQNQLHLVREFEESDLDILKEIASLVRGMNLLVSEKMLQIDER